MPNKCHVCCIGNVYAMQLPIQSFIFIHLDLRKMFIIIYFTIAYTCNYPSNSSLCMSNFNHCFAIELFVPSCIHYVEKRLATQANVLGCNDVFIMWSVVCAKKVIVCWPFENKIIQQQKYSIPYLQPLNIASKPATITKSQRLTTNSGRDTRHLVWFKSCRQYTTGFPLTLLTAFHMTQYQRIYQWKPRRRCWSQVNLRNMWHPRVKYAVDWAIRNLIGIPAFQNETSSCLKILATVVRHCPEFRGVRLGTRLIELHN